MTQAVRVELASSPEEWMCPAFIAFQAALYEYYPLAPDHIKSETLVFHVTTFFEPERPLGCEGSEVPTLSETHDVLVSDPVSYIVPKKSSHINGLRVLPFGTWFDRNVSGGMYVLCCGFDDDRSKVPEGAGQRRGSNKAQCNRSFSGQNRFHCIVCLCWYAQNVERHDVDFSVVFRLVSNHGMQLDG